MPSLGGRGQTPLPKKEMLINYVPGEECRIAIVEDGTLEEFYQERASAESHVSNIYKGRVTNVEPSIQAAFVDFGLERNGFLHISDVHPMYFPGKDREEFEQVGSKTPRRDRPPIQKCFRRGQEVLVQVLKEGIGTKGPTVTSYLSIPGRFLVMMPYMQRLGVSRKVEDDEARKQMRDILKDLNPPKEFGFIVRTAGIGQNKTDLKRDLAYLTRLWKAIEQKRKSIGRVGELYAESDLVIRTIRDVFTTDIGRVVVDDLDAARRAQDFLGVANPRTKSQVVYYEDPVPLFHRFDIEPQIETISSREVPLKSGGALVVDQTEALVAIDVNSGKSREARDAETNAYKTNEEAVDEICRQLRLRDMGGLVVLDLIDMSAAKHRRSIEQRLRNNLKRDRARTRVGPISQFGLVEMTRQRMRPSLRKSMYADCQHCGGRGYTASVESVVLDVMRRLALAMHHEHVARIELTISPDVAFHLLNRKRAELTHLEQRHNIHVLVRVGGHTVDYVHIEAFNDRGGVIDVAYEIGGKNLAKPTGTTFRELDDQTLPDTGDEADQDEEGEAPAEAATDEAPEQETQASGKPGGGQDTRPDQDASGSAGEGEGSKRKRRRRRRGRGRKKSGEGGEGESAQGPSEDKSGEDKADSEDASSGKPSAADEAEQTAEASDAGEDDEQKKKRRRRRGGRGRRKKKSGEGGGDGGQEGSDTSSNQDASDRGSGSSGEPVESGGYANRLIDRASEPASAPESNA